MKSPEHIAIGTWKFQTTVAEGVVLTLAKQWAKSNEYLDISVYLGENGAPCLNYKYALKDGSRSTHQCFFHRTNEGLIERFGLDEDALKHGNVRRAVGVKGWSHNAPRVVVVKQVELT